MTDLVPIEDSGKPTPVAKQRATRHPNEGESASATDVQNGSVLPISSDVRELEKRIEEGHATIGKLAAEFIGRTLPKAKAIGELLNAWKKVLGHGKLEENLLGLQSRIGLSPRTARSYMQIAKDWKKLKQVAGDTISDLSIRAALRMVSGGRRNSEDTDGDQNNCIDAEFVVVGVSETVDTGPPNLEILSKSQAFRAFFGAALVDPWGLTHRDHAGCKRSPSEIRGLPVPVVLRPSSHLFLVAGDPHLVEALRTIKAWGYWYSHSFVIARNEPQEHGNEIPQGHYFVLCGSRGQQPFRATQLTSWIDAAGDSIQEIHQRIELSSDGPFVQIFGQPAVTPSDWCVVG